MQPNLILEDGPITSLTHPSSLPRGMRSSEDDLEISAPESYAQGHAVHIEGTH